MICMRMYLHINKENIYISHLKIHTRVAYLFFKNIFNLVSVCKSHSHLLRSILDLRSHQVHLNNKYQTMISQPSFSKAGTNQCNVFHILMKYMNQQNCLNYLYIYTSDNTCSFSDTVPASLHSHLWFEGFWLSPY